MTHKKQKILLGKNILRFYNLVSRVHKWWFCECFLESNMDISEISSARRWYIDKIVYTTTNSQYILSLRLSSRGRESFQPVSCVYSTVHLGRHVLLHNILLIYLFMSHSLKAVPGDMLMPLETRDLQSSLSLAVLMNWWKSRPVQSLKVVNNVIQVLSLSTSFFCLSVAWCLQGGPSIWSHAQIKLAACVWLCLNRWSFSRMSLIDVKVARKLGLKF